MRLEEYRRKEAAEGKPLFVCDAVPIDLFGSPAAQRGLQRILDEVERQAREDRARNAAAFEQLRGVYIVAGNSTGYQG